MTKIELFKRNNDRFYFRVITETGHNMLSSDGYETKPECENIVDLLKRNITEKQLVSVENKNPETWKFTVNSNAGVPIGYSMDFHNKRQCNNWLKILREHLPAAPVFDLTTN